MKKHLAFTLAETLIVMGVIGVVAALTLPNLNQSTGNKEKAVKLQKLYSNLNDALGRAQVVYGPIDTWSKDGNMTERFMNRLFEFMKVSKNCGLADSSKTCWSESLSDHPHYGSFITADGSGVFVFASFNCNECELKSGECTCGSIKVDVDGAKKGKNQEGTDIFWFLITKNAGVIPRHSRDTTWLVYPTWCFGAHQYCTPWVIENGNMDYLKANSQGKCPNGTVLSETNTSCN